MSCTIGLLFRMLSRVGAALATVCLLFSRFPFFFNAFEDPCLLFDLFESLEPRRLVFKCLLDPALDPALDPVFDPGFDPGFDYFDFLLRLVALPALDLDDRLVSLN